MVTRVLDGLGLYFEGRETVATGFSSLDRLLPAGGVRRGSLVEWLAGGAECLAGGDGGGAEKLGGDANREDEPDCGGVDVSGSGDL
jgi:hypothetical protein